MLARRNSLSHEIALEIELPLLVPSFSSKGFPLRKRRGKKHDYTDVVYDLAALPQHSSNAALLSAYDFYFKHFDDAPKLPPTSGPQDYLRETQLVFIDSGGYELISDFDRTEFRTFAYKPKMGFGYEQYTEVLRNLTSLEEPLPLVITNFDRDSTGKPIKEQIAAARGLFYDFPGPLTDFILKPWTENMKEIHPTEMTDDDFANLGGFDIVGIAEKELGRDPLGRLRAVATFRQRLDNAGLASVPLHIWGGLDPVMTPLYFFAGAEIFDGVSWLRYAFRDGIAINRESHSILNDTMGINTKSDENNAFAGLTNLHFLDNLAASLQRWVDLEATSFDMFEPGVAHYLEKAYKVMVTRSKPLKGGA